MTQSHPGLAMAESSGSLKIQVPTESRVDPKPTTALPKAPKSLSHRSEDTKPLEEHESRSPRPPALLKQVARRQPPDTVARTPSPRPAVVADR